MAELKSELAKELGSQLTNPAHLNALEEFDLANIGINPVTGQLENPTQARKLILEALILAKKKAKLSELD
jgi:hypothetical protein